MPQETEEGFSLIEAVAALAILASAVAAVYAGLAQNWRAIGASNRQAQVLQIAQNQIALASIEAPLVDGRTMSNETDGISWQIKIEQRPSGESEDPNRPRAYWIVFDASWRDARSVEPRTMHLRSLKLEPARP